MNAESLPISLQIRIDKACDRFEAAWQDGQRPRMEDYLAEMPEPERAELFHELLKMELELRGTDGELPTQEEYEARFPEHIDFIKAVFRQQSTVDTDSVADPADAPIAEPSCPAPACLGRYQVRGRIAGGAFGDVYLAHDPDFDRLVAIKVPNPRFLATQDARAAFLNEARSVGRLKHGNIVRAYDFGQDPDGRCYIVYEYIEGTNLRQRLEQGLPAAEEAALIVAQVAEALHYAHLEGLVHRDIKPANILLDQQGKPKVTDFGLAVREEDLWQLRGQLAGTYPYMSPEQVRREGHLIDGRTDIYSLGVVLYELLCGRRPFEAVVIDDLKELILHREAKPPRQIKDSIPAELERVCLKALSKRISDRYTTAKDMAREVRELIEKDSERNHGAAQSDLLLHRLWNDLDSDLQDALSLAYNQAAREGKSRISTRTFFAALARLQPVRLAKILSLLPRGSLPDPVDQAVPTTSQILKRAPLLSDCIQDALIHLSREMKPEHKLTPEEVFVDVARHGTGPSVKRLRTHGVTPAIIDQLLKQLGWRVLERSAAR